MILLRSFARFVPIVGLSFALAAAVAAPQAAPRAQGFVNEAQRVVLHGNVHPLARAGAGQAEVDLGPVEDSFPAGRMLLLLSRTAARRRARPMSSP